MHQRKLAGRTITMHHLTNPVRKGLNTDMAASYVTKVELGPADNFLKPIYEERVLGVSAVPAPAPAPKPEPEPEPAPDLVDGQLLVNADFTNGTTGWTSSTGFGTYNFYSGSQPAVTATINDNGIVGSTGYLVMSYASATVSQTAPITITGADNTITAVLNIARIPNREDVGIDEFSFQVIYKNASNGTVAIKRTPASGTQRPPAAFTNYTLVLNRADEPDFDTITSATVNITGVDNGYWAGQYGPAIEYCSLRLS